MKLHSQIFFILIMLTLAGMPVYADPGSDSELVLQDGYLDGHTFRYLEKHIHSEVTFTVVEGQAKKRKDRESITNKLLTGEYMYRIESLTICIKAVNLTQEQAVGSPRIFRHLNDNAANITIQPRLDTPTSLYMAKLFGKIKKSGSPLLKGDITAWLSETTSKEGVKTENMTIALERVVVP